MEWFNNLDVVVQAAIISGLSAILVAIISGLFAIISNGKKRNNNGTDKSLKSTVITQNANGNHNTVIGIQNNIRRKDDE